MFTVISQVTDCLSSLSQKSLEHKHGWLLVLGHAFSRFIRHTKETKYIKDFQNWSHFIDAIKVIGKFYIKTIKRILHKFLKKFLFI